MSARVLILDTTLRGYRKSPVQALSSREKLVVARQLENLGVDIIEAGFPARSVGDEEGVRYIAQEIKAVRVVARARAVLEDIESAWTAVEKAVLPGIHTFLPTSDVLLERKVRMSREQVIEYTAHAVSMAKSLSDWVQFSCEDATRSDTTFLSEVIRTAVESGAGTINLIDSRGRSYPDQMVRLVKHVLAAVPGSDRFIVSVNCHDHLGLAVANSIAAARAGARQVECAVSGAGEGAGNASLQQIATVMKIREKSFQLHTGIVTKQINRANRIINAIVGIPDKPNRMLRRSSSTTDHSQEDTLQSNHTGTHDDLSGPAFLGSGRLPSFSGEDVERRDFEDRVNSLGYRLSSQEITIAFLRFQELARTKQTLFDEDIEAVIAEEVLRNSDNYKLVSVTVMSGSDVLTTARVWMEIAGKKCSGAELGNGPVDATFNTICKLTGRTPKVLDFSITSITGGADALGRATIRVEEAENTALGQGSHEDIVIASARAMVNALNRLDFMTRKRDSNLLL